MSKFSPLAGTRRLQRLGTRNLRKPTTAEREHMGFSPGHGPKNIFVRKTQKRFSLRTPFLTGHERRETIKLEMPKVPLVGTSGNVLLDQANWAVSDAGHAAADKHGATKYYRVSSYIISHREFMGTLTAMSGLTFTLAPSSTLANPVWTHSGKRKPRIIPKDRWERAYAHWAGSMKFYKDPTISWALFDAIQETPNHQQSPKVVVRRLDRAA